MHTNIATSFTDYTTKTEAETRVNFYNSARALFLVFILSALNKGTIFTTIISYN